jgi:hypothetical protein
MRIHMLTLKRVSLSFQSRLAVVALSGMLAAGLFGLSGCTSGSSVNNIQVGTITFASSTGTALKTQPSSLTAGQSAFVTVNLTNDPQLLGANWSVYCGSAPPPGTPLSSGETQDESCGTFTPVHTLSLPIPSYVTDGSGYVAYYTAPSTAPKNGSVTLYASSTANPTKVTSLTIAIDSLPISIGFAPSPVTTLAAGTSTQLRAVVNNDAASAGIKWSVACGSSSCGSFSPTQTASAVATTYTAPSAVPTGSKVTVTATSATDSTKAVSATITIQ